jgi:hypothetical protein
VEARRGGTTQNQTQHPENTPTSAHNQFSTTGSQNSETVAQRTYIENEASCCAGVNQVTDLSQQNALFPKIEP